MSDAAPSSGAQIAVIGMAGRFPGARNLDEYWRNLAAGVESVKFFTAEELLKAGESPAALQDPNYVPAWPVLEDIDAFDAGFFGMSPRDAAVMDPQHRLYLQTAWAALEDAGYDVEAIDRPVGVFAANGMNTYMMFHLVTNQDVMDTVGEWLVRHTGNDMNFLATRVSYQMNLKGPSMNVQTACSSSMVAVHTACQSLLNGECDMALAGASTLSLPQDRGYLFKEGEILSRDGHCRPFDAGSRGTLFGSGAGCVVLKRLSDAVADGDPIRAVILGSAINNDGSLKVGYLAPSVDGQVRAVSEALAISGVDAESIGYIEAHGTGTAIGDPIEITALTQAFAGHTDRRQFCAIGSVKANIGHLGEAAGMAGFIKTVLALQKKQLPPSINYEKPNPEIDFAASPVFVNARLTDWKAKPGVPRRAGITALGAGGTNAHMILEEAPPPPPSGARTRSQQLIVLSARTEAALERMTDNLVTHLREHPELALADVAHTLQVGRKQFAHRRTVVVRDSADLAAVLEKRDPKRIATQLQSKSAGSMVFMFPGGGAQYSSMGQELYQSEPVYKEALDECLATLPAALATTVRGLLFPPPAELEAATVKLEQPSLTLPALFATEYAMARLLMSWGLTPAALIGHSMGEYVAASLAGMISARDGMALVSLRGRLFETLPAGGMLSVSLSEAEARPYLGSELSFAAVNAPNLCVVSGPVEAIERLQQELTAKEIECTRIHISVAAHSKMLTPILDEFGRFCRTIKLHPPTIPVMSNLTGAWITPAEATDSTYWVRHLRNTVRFAEGLAKVVEGEPRVLVEVGPGRTLSSLAKQQPPPVSPALPTLRHPKEPASDVAFLLQTLGRLWAQGLKPDWSLYWQREQRRRLPLPSYPFEQQRYWIERGDPQAAAPRKTAAAVKKTDVGDWFAVPSWKRALPQPPRESQGPWLIFCDPEELGPRLAQRLPGNAVFVSPGTHFLTLKPNHFRLRPGSRDDHEALIEELEISGRMPEQIVHLWALAPRAPWALPVSTRWSELDNFDVVREKVFDSLLFLGQSLSTRERPVTLSVVSNGLHALGGETVAHPIQALLLGPTRVIPRELRHVAARNIDLQSNLRGRSSDEALDRLAAELRTPAGEPVVVLRGSGRWVQSLDPLRLEPADAKPALRPRGVYLITGGLGGIGLEVAEHLATLVRARLVLVGRSDFPARGEWDRWLARHGTGDPTSQRIRRLKAIEAHGGEVLVCSADVTDRVDMEAVVAAARERFGSINGVVHSAGTIDDGLLAMKSPEVAAGVIATKAKGTLVLDALLAHDTLDFFLSCSSVSSLLGLEGQIDYTAANAFLDAHAAKARSRQRPRVLSVNWNAWQQIGMAVALAERGRGHTQATSGQKGPHPLLARLLADSPTESLFATDFSQREHWLLSEHVIRGADAVIPGTGYLELARAALAARPQARTVELSGVFFLAPFSVHGGETRTLKLKLERGADGGGTFTFFSKSEDAPHVTGRIGYVDAPAPAREDLPTIIARCRESERVVNGLLDQPFVDFGPRWANIDRIVYGKGEAVVCLSLRAEFQGDLADLHLHPALLDMATGAAQGTVPGFDQARDFYVPFSYGRFRLYRPLPARAFSHVRFKKGTKDVVSFDVAIYDAAGERVADVEDFAMKRVDDVSVMAHPVAQTGMPGSRLGAVVQQGILPAEGMDAFDRLIASPLQGQVVACSVDLPAWIERVDAEARPVQVAPGEATAEGAGFSRPQLSTKMVAPRDQVEEQLAVMWRELLGVKEVGINDDFFELGGQSLIAVRLFNKIRQKYSVDLPLSTLFEAPTIAQCAAIVREDAGIASVPLGAPSSGNGVPAAAAATNGVPAPAEEAEEAETEEVEADASNGAPASRTTRKSRWTSLVRMQTKGSLPPFYCVAGMGGTLNNLRKLALLVGDARPFYGLQPPGAEDSSQRLWRVEELAEHYIREVRSVQPHGPYLLGGYSGGGTVAFEMSKQLSAEGETIAFLGFIDSYSPDLPRRSATERAKVHLRRAQMEGPNYFLRMLKHRVIYEKLVMQERVTKQLAKVFPDKYRYENIADSWKVAEGAYHPGPWPGGRAVLFRAREESAIGLWTGVVVDELHGWGRYLPGGVELQITPGNHATMCEDPHVRALASKMRDAMDRASPPVAAGAAHAPTATL